MHSKLKDRQVLLPTDFQGYQFSIRRLLLPDGRVADKWHQKIFFLFVGYHLLKWNNYKFLNSNYLISTHIKIVRWPKKKDHLDKINRQSLNWHLYLAFFDKR